GAGVRQVDAPHAIVRRRRPDGAERVLLALIARADHRELEVAARIEVDEKGLVRLQTADVDLEQAGTARHREELLRVGDRALYGYQREVAQRGDRAPLDVLRIADVCGREQGVVTVEDRDRIERLRVRRERDIRDG